MILLSASRAWAQASTALDRFEPAPAGDPLPVPSPVIRPGLNFATGFALSVAHAPLALYSPDGDSIGDVVAVNATLHNLVGLEVGGFLEIDLDVPFTVYQAGASPTYRVGGESRTLESPEGFAMNDLRLGAKLEVLEQQGGVPSAAILLAVWAPTGDADAFTSAGHARYAPALLVGAEYPGFEWTTSLGALAAHETSDLRTQELQTAVALGPRFGPVQLSGGVDVDISIANLPAGRRPTVYDPPHVEVFIASRVSFGPVDVGLSGGVGVTRSPGTPDLRGVLTAQYVLRTGPNDPPPLRRAHPQPEPLRISTCEDPGCGPSLAMSRPAPPRSPPAVSEPGEPQAAPADASRPGIVTIVGEQIVITQSIQFSSGKSTLLPASEPVLHGVAGLLASHPELARISIEGHTDDRGVERANIELSRARAAAVMRWLIDHGVDERRLEASGFGPRRPIADNRTPAGRDANRRVDFQILRRNAKGAEGWQGGAAEGRTP